MQAVTPHDIDGQQMAQALEDIRRRAFGRWHSMQYGGMRLSDLAEMRDELLDHAAARIARDPSLDTHLRHVLHTAAECSLGLLSVGCFPNGDQEIRLPLVGEQLSSEDKAFHDIVTEAPTATQWIETFELCLISGLVWEWRRVIGGLLREDYAPAIRDGVPYSTFESVSQPADRAQMDALAEYLTPTSGHLPSGWPTVTLSKPGADERAEAARRLDAAGPLTPDQRLLRCLLDDDQPAFEQLLVAGLNEYRDSIGDDPAPRTLLPTGSLAIAALAVQAHGWRLSVHSAYLPQTMLGSPDALARAAATGPNNLGGWVPR
ncbi:immunity 49 family protein [Streptomyces erythrochromogenes]|uniref:immunity 49 family protein n=1 Tax=Streptomyces erythrochromogenes TaxID=285574 RepID=UPI0034290473